MKKYISIICKNNNREQSSQQLANELEKGSWVRLCSEKETHVNININMLPPGPGIIIKGGGSTGNYQQCLHSYSHFDQSASATAQWIRKQGIDPGECYIFNPLPLNHVSGLLPWWRSRCWGAKHIWVTRDFMHNHDKLKEKAQSLLMKGNRPIVTSLIPTQLYQLLQSSSGIRWLQLCTIIWVGGSSMSKRLVDISRSLQIRLAPCYGTTETAAMVTAQTPKDFLSGQNCLGSPLDDVELRLGEENSLQIRTQRLAKILLKDGTLKSVGDQQGWWESGDSAEIAIHNHIQQLKIIGRKDTAINSGGEIVFPEALEKRLVEAAQKEEIPLKAILLIPIKDEKWGERLVALVRLKVEEDNHGQEKLFGRLQNIVKIWDPFERPIAWYYCPELTRNNLGKWEIKKWQSWVKLKRANTSI